MPQTEANRPTTEEFWFDNAEAMQETMSSHDRQAVASNIANFATGGVKLMVGEVEK